MHECPDCYSSCHCGGDIDDLLLNSDKYVNHCTHCDRGSDWEEEQFCDEYDHDNDCPRCQGSGEVPTESFESYLGQNFKPCPMCGGNGDR